MKQENPPAQVIIEQGTANPEAWAAYLEGAREIGSRVLPYEVMGGAENAPPRHLSQGDFVRLVGEGQRRLATQAWMATLLVRRRGGFQFEPEQGEGIRTTGLVFSSFAQRVRIMRSDVSAGGSVSDVTKIHLGKAVKEDHFNFWGRVVDHFSPPQNPVQ